MTASLLIPPSFGLHRPLRNRVPIVMDLLLPPICSGTEQLHASQVQLVGGATTGLGPKPEDKNNWKWERSLSFLFRSKIKCFIPFI